MLNYSEQLFAHIRNAEGGKLDNDLLDQINKAIEDGADVNYSENEEGYAPQSCLSLAVMISDVANESDRALKDSLVQSLINKGADVGIASIYLQCELFIPEVRLMALDEGADIKRITHYIHRNLPVLIAVHLNSLIKMVEQLCLAPKVDHTALREKASLAVMNITNAIGFLNEVATTQRQAQAQSFGTSASFFSNATKSGSAPSTAPTPVK